MKHRIIDNQNGCLVCCFSNEYLESSIPSDSIYENTKFTRIIFIDNNEESILSHIDSITFSGQIDICFCNPNTIGIHEAIELHQSRKIRNIIITPNCLYSFDQPDMFLGYEYWFNGWTPDALHSYDSTSNRVSDINDLMEKAEYVAKSLASKKPDSDLEKIILTDAWIQMNIQYATGKRSEADGGVYICETLPEDSNVHDPLLHGYGRCEDIALSASLILNHPALGVHCRQVGAQKNNGINHSWNIVRCNNLEYYVDFTHNITRNPHKVKNALRATSYSYQFTLLGLDDAYEKYGTTDLYSNKLISSESFDRNIIAKTVETLEQRGVLKTSWNPDPIIPSVFVKG